MAYNKEALIECVLSADSAMKHEDAITWLKKHNVLKQEVNGATSDSN